MMKYHESFCMSQALEGIQFPINSTNNKPSTSKTGQAILSEALSTVDHKTSQQVLSEKNWRKKYPIYFKALVENGIRNQENPIEIAQAGLNKAHHSFEFYRDGQKCNLAEMMSLEAQPLYSVKLQGESEAKPEWYVPYHGQNLKGQALLDQIQVVYQKVC